MWGNVQIVDYPIGDRLAILDKFPLQIHLIAIYKVVAIADEHQTCVDINILYIEILIYLFQFVHFGLRNASGIYQSVVHIRLVDMIDDVPILFAVFIFATQGLIFPVPRKTTLVALIGSKKLPILAEVAQAVPHRMGVFADNHRAFRVFGKEIVQVVELGVHIRDDIVMREHACISRIFGLIMHRAFLRVEGFYRLVSCIKVLTPTRFIPHRPIDDTRVVLVASNHIHIALHNVLLPFRAFAYVVATLPQSVALDIGFIYHI